MSESTMVSQMVTFAESNATTYHTALLHRNLTKIGVMCNAQSGIHHWEYLMTHILYKSEYHIIEPNKSIYCVTEQQSIYHLYNSYHRRHPVG